MIRIDHYDRNWVVFWMNFCILSNDSRIFLDVWQDGKDKILFDQ